MFGFRRRYFRARGWRWHEVPQDACPRVLDALRANGPMTVTELGGARRGGEWWDWSDVKIAVEFLLDVGDVVCTERRAWKRVYDLPERALPPEVLADEPDDETCLRRLVGQAGVALGVATVGDLADYHAQARSGPGGARRHGARRGAGGRLRDDAWPTPRAGRARHARAPSHDAAVGLRLARGTAPDLRVFDFHHRLEAYVPAPNACTATPCRC